MKFKFKLAPVLKVREHEEEQQKMRFAAALQKKTDLQRHAESIEQDLETINGRDIRQDEMTPAVFQRHYASIHQKHQELQKVQHNIAKAEKEVVTEREKLIEANMRTKMIKTLENKERENFLAELQRVEQNQLNEIATQMYNSPRGK